VGSTHAELLHNDHRRLGSSIHKKKLSLAGRAVVVGCTEIEQTPLLHLVIRGERGDNFVVY
jgi:hypothetical protein